eukprot:1734102-Pyramimonas_sp.AAC.1
MRPRHGRRGRPRPRRGPRLTRTAGRISHVGAVPRGRPAERPRGQHPPSRRPRARLQVGRPAVEAPRRSRGSRR